MLCFAAIVLIINQLIYLEKIRLPNFLKRIFRSYFTLSIGVIVILFFQILVKDADKLNRAWDNHLVLTNYFNSYTKMECTLLSEIKSGMSANYNTKRMEFYNDFHDYTNDKPFVIEVMLSESEYRGENLIRYMIVLYEPYDAVRYQFMTPYSQYISLAKPDDLKIFKGKTSIVFRRLDTDAKAFFELEFDTQTNEMIIKEKNFLEKINYETNNIPEWKKKFYEKSLGELVSESSQQLQCNYN